MFMEIESPTAAEQILDDSINHAGFPENQAVHLRLFLRVE